MGGYATSNDTHVGSCHRTEVHHPAYNLCQITWEVRHLTFEVFPSPVLTTTEWPRPRARYRRCRRPLVLGDKFDGSRSSARQRGAIQEAQEIVSMLGMCAVWYLLHVVGDESFPRPFMRRGKTKIKVTNTSLERVETQQQRGVHLCHDSSSTVQLERRASIFPSAARYFLALTKNARAFTVYYSVVFPKTNIVFGPSARHPKLALGPCRRHPPSLWAKCAPRRNTRTPICLRCYVTRMPIVTTNDYHQDKASA